MSKPNAEQLVKINKFARTPLTEDEVYVFTSMMIDNAVTSYSTIVHENLLRKFSVDVKRGIGLLLSHDSSKLPVGRTFDATLVEDWDERTGESLKSLYGDHYIALGRNTESGMTTDDIAKGIDSGTIFDTSIGFNAKSMKCSICGNDIRSYDCPHFPGREYIVEDDEGVGVKETCYAIIGEDGEGELIENSLVYAGACNRATIVNEYSMGSDSTIGNKPRLQLVKDIKKIPLNASVYQFYTKSGIVLMTEEGIFVGGEENEKRSESAMDKYKAILEEHGIKSEDELKAKLSELDSLTTKIENKDGELTKKEEVVTKLNSELTKLKEDLSKKETELAELKESNTKLTELNSKLKENAELVETYKKDLTEEILELGVRTQGNAFNKTLFEKFLSTLSIEELKETKEGFSKEVTTKFGAAKTTKTKVADKKKADDELYREDFETEEEFREHIAELALSYSKENKISLIDATKILYDKYSERGDE